MPPMVASDDELEDQVAPPSKTKTKRGSAKKAMVDLEDFLSPDESQDEDIVPARRTPAKAAVADADANDENGDEEAKDGQDEEDDDDAEPEGDEYVVEKIVNHQYDEVENVWKYYVKWKGYEKLRDRTWEPVENLTNAKGILNEYHKSIGGKPERPPVSERKRGRGRPSQGTSRSGGKGAKARKLNTGAASKTATPATDDQDSKWKPPQGSWEDDVQAVDTIEKDEQGLHVFLQWNNGKKSKHPIEQTYKKCPEKMLHFYEQHLVFKEGGGKMTKAEGGKGEGSVDEDEVMAVDDEDA